MPPIKVPTNEEYRAYDGAHCFRLWNRIDNSWKCTGCSRGKREIMRWTKRQAKLLMGIHEPYWGWIAGLHSLRDRTGRSPNTIICDQCSSASSIAKRRLALPADFHFTPNEIRMFITATPHGRHKIDFAKAKRAYELHVEDQGLTDEDDNLDVPSGRVPCEMMEIELDGDHGTVASVRATCQRCRHEIESYGTGQDSIRRCLALMREECPRGETNFYIGESE